MAADKWDTRHRPAELLVEASGKAGALGPAGPPTAQQQRARRAFAPLGNLRGAPITQQQEPKLQQNMEEHLPLQQRRQPPWSRGRDAAAEGQQQQQQQQKQLQQERLDTTASAIGDSRGHAESIRGLWFHPASGFAAAAAAAAAAADMQQWEADIRIAAEDGCILELSFDAIAAADRPAAALAAAATDVLLALSRHSNDWHTTALLLRVNPKP